MQEKSYLKYTSLSKTVFWDFYSLNNKNSLFSIYPIVKLKEVIYQRKESIKIDDFELYKRCRVQVQAKGVILRDEVFGKEIKTKKQQLCKTEDFLVAEIDAKVGGYGIVPESLENAIVSGHYFLFEIDKSKLMPDFLGLVVKQYHFSKQIKSTGSTNYAAIRPYHVLEYEIPLPTLEQQKRIIEVYNSKLNLAEQQEKEAKQLKKSIEKYLFEELGIIKAEKRKTNSFLQFITYTKISEWGLDKIFNSNELKSSIYDMTSFEINPNLAKSIFRGKSPKYSDNSTKLILNQKCNRWNDIEIEHSKTVDKLWFNGIDKNFFTKEGDIIINSTGEGTIGRATCLTNEYEGLLYDSHMLLLRVNKSVIDPSFYTYLFNSHFGQNQVDGIKSAQSTKQTELGVNNLKKIVFPLPPIEKQKEISEKIQSIKSQIKELNTLSLKNKKEAISVFEKEIFNYKL